MTRTPERPERTSGLISGAAGAATSRSTPNASARTSPPALDLAGLAETAKEATPGPWRSIEIVMRTRAGDVTHASVEAPAPETHLHTIAAVGANVANARYIAAASPDVILALCAELTALRERVSEGERKTEEWFQKAGEYWEMVVAQDDANATLRIERDALARRVSEGEREAAIGRAALAHFDAEVVDGEEHEFDQYTHCPSCETIRTTREAMLALLLAARPSTETDHAR